MYQGFHTKTFHKLKKLCNYLLFSSYAWVTKVASDMKAFQN